MTRPPTRAKLLQRAVPPTAANCNAAVEMVYPAIMPAPQMIAANWKMNGLTADAETLARAVLEGAAALDAAARPEIVLCPPATQIANLARLLAASATQPKPGLGGQDCHPEPHGAHTGDISAPMLADLGATHVIVGHSERRQNHAELDETVREKVVAAHREKLVPIVCVGETLDQRERGEDTEVVGWQLQGSLPQDFSERPGVIAYEPVWAIGTGRHAEPDDVATMHRFIREELVRQFGEAGRAIRILYGGSVKAANAAALLACAEVGGALVGGASLVADDFLAICRAARPTA